LSPSREATPLIKGIFNCERSGLVRGGGYFPYFITSAKLIASSIPGNALSKSWAIALPIDRVSGN
jgi:hypothetical protein